MLLSGRQSKTQPRETPFVCVCVAQKRGIPGCKRSFKLGFKILPPQHTHIRDFLLEKKKQNPRKSLEASGDWKDLNQPNPKKEEGREKRLQYMLSETTTPSLVTVNWD